MISSGINLVMAVVGFTLSIMFITFVCIRLICARILSSSSRRSFGRAFGFDLTTMERGYRGLEPRTLANFPTKKYRELCLSSKEDAQCTVCLSDYHNDDTLRLLPICGHSFHARCIDIWLHQHFTCPVCRISLRDLPQQEWFASSHWSQHNMHYCQCSTADNRQSLTSHDNDGADTVQEGRCCSEGNGNCQHTAKNTTSREVTSPSSP